MPPSARHTPVVAPCLATIPRSALEWLIGFVAESSTPRCVVPAMSWTGKSRGDATPIGNGA